MKLIDEIIDLLSSSEPSLENAMFKAQVLASKLQDKSLGDWVQRELCGYSDPSEVPSYRVLKVTLMGNVSNGAWRYSETVLPTMKTDARLIEKLEIHRVTESISAVQQWTKGKSITISVVPEFYPYLNKSLQNGFQIETAWGQVSEGHFIQLLVQVRSRLLDLALALKTRLPEHVSATELPNAAKSVGFADIFKDTVFRDNTTIVIGSNTVGPIANSVVRGDFASLAKALQDHGVAEVDVAELQEAVKGDLAGSTSPPTALGPRVKSWMGGMLSKAGTAGWTISASTAGGILTSLLKRYFNID